jgi:hypothetical protein
VRKPDLPFLRVVVTRGQSGPGYILDARLSGVGAHGHDRAISSPRSGSHGQKPPAGQPIVPSLQRMSCALPIRQPLLASALP